VFQWPFTTSAQETDGARNYKPHRHLR